MQAHVRFAAGNAADWHVAQVQDVWRVVSRRRVARASSSRALHRAHAVGQRADRAIAVVQALALAADACSTTRWCVARGSLSTTCGCRVARVTVADFCTVVFLHVLPSQRALVLTLMVPSQSPLLAVATLPLLVARPLRGWTTMWRCPPQVPLECVQHHVCLGPLRLPAVVPVDAESACLGACSRVSLCAHRVICRLTQHISPLSLPPRAVWQRKWQRAGRQTLADYDVRHLLFRSERLN